MSEKVERKANRDAKENVRESTKEYSFALNKLLQVVGENKEYKNAVKRDEAKYRLIHLVENTETAFDAIDNLREELYKQGYIVDILEDFECKDVNKEGRYTIRVSKSKVFVKIDLLEYKENINNFEFNVLEFWEAYINKINGGIVKESVKVAKLIAEYLSYIMYFRYLYTATYKEIGWEKYVWDKIEWIFKYDQIYSRIPFLKGNIVDGYGDGLAAIKDMEDIGDTTQRTMTMDPECGQAYCINWVVNTINLLNKHDIICLLIGAGVSGVIRSLLPFTKETNININITGAPASGKSIIGHYILSIFGDPERLEGSFTDTDNAMEQKRVQRPILPYVLDERMLKVQGEPDKTKEKTVLMDIFREYEGKVKERLGKQYQEYSGERTYGPIISSSVESMMKLVFKSSDLGQYRRFMEFDVSRKDKVTAGTYVLFDSAEEAKQAEEIAYKYYGYGIIILVEYLLDLLHESSEQHILDRFNHIDKTVKDILQTEEINDKIQGLSSSSKRFALIILSYQLFREALINYTTTVQIPNMSRRDIWNNRLETFEQENLIKEQSGEILDILVDNVKQKFKKVSIIAKLTNNLDDYIFEHQDCFFECKNANTGWYHEGEEDNTKYLGKWIENGNKIEIYLYKTYHLERLLFMPTIPEPQIIFNYMKELEENNKKDTDNILDKYGALSKEQAKKYREDNPQYGYRGFDEKNLNCKFGRKIKPDGAVIITISRAQTDTDSDKEETEKSEKATNKGTATTKTKKQTTNKEETK